MAYIDSEKLKKEINNAINEEEKADYHKDITRIGMNGGLRLALQIIERMEKYEE
ncbi:hypothetical protein ACDQ58_06385 [Fusobacterium animalis]|uniref:hypothetical protein n=1 Tax=Fusobacterium TaxID=848 RepID=UPI00201A9B34|nr:hypothetical protein [Fusobacterium nucleatum]